MSITKISEEQINSFLNGRDPQTGIIAIECGYNDSEVSIIYRQFPTLEKRIKTASFEPFLWAKISGSRKLFIDKNTKEQDKRLLKKKMDEYCISAKGLNIYSEEGKTTERLENGYRVLFTVTKKMSYNRFLQFFKEGGVDIFDDSKDFIQVSPIEQYMIRSGKRMFKGFEDYDDLVRLEFDLETQGLNPEIHRIDQIGIRTNKGFEFIIPIEDAETKRQKDRNELDAIKLYFSIIKEIKPDVITGHNSENFDWNFIIKRCEMLGTSIKEVSGEYFKTPLYKKQRKTVLKLGGEVEYFNQTVLWGHNITDSLHAIRRAQAIDSNMKKADLKYVTKYSKLNKDNRIYVPGDQIKVLWADKTNDYALNDNNGEWYKITEKYPLKDDFEITTGRYIIERYLKDDLYETDKVELRYNQPNFLLCKILPTTFNKVCTMGTAGIWKLIMMTWSFEHNLAIPATAPTRAFTGGLSRLLKVGVAPNVVKLDYNSLYPSIDITWDVAPDHDIMNVMLSLLEYVLTEREKNKDLKGVAKKAGNKLKKDIELIDSKTKEYNDILNEIKNKESEENLYDKKQIVLKILANSFFGSLGSSLVFAWGDMSCAEKTTCIGRMSLRLLVKWFNERKFTPILMDTDGVNFTIPENNYSYVGKGLNRNTKEGEIYNGVEAYAAEFNDLFMRGKMGLGIDEYVVNSINFSRKNYCDLLDADNQDIKYVGNTIKSKRMPTYIERFMENGIKLLLYNKGGDFLNYYYDYIEQIYNYKIPLREIASKGKVKKSIKEYVQDCKTLTKAGRPKNRQVWYELLLRNNTTLDVGETVYYINVGDGKKKTSYKDVEKKTIKNKEDGTETYEIIINCVMLDKEVVEAAEDSFCDNEIEYNAPKYIEQFNNRVKPLLVCFSPEIRNKILVKTPDKRQFFTEDEVKLSSGEPNKPEDQDTYEQLMSMEDKEIRFWKSINEVPPFVDEIGYDWDSILKDYDERMEMLKDERIKIEVDKYNKIIDNLTGEEINAFINEIKIPKNLSSFVKIDSKTMNFVSKEYDVVIGSIYDIVDKEKEINEDDEEENE